jgi:uncharacterized protein (DUF2461 family)
MLAALRNAIAKGNGRTFLKVAGDLRKAKLDFGHGGDQIARMPRGFESHKGGPLDDVLRRKSLIVEQTFSEAQLGSASLPNAIADFAGRAMPLLRFGWKALA